MNMAIKTNYDLGRIAKWRVMISFEETIHSLPHGLWVCLFNKNLCCDIDIGFFFLTVYVETV